MTAATSRHVAMSIMRRTQGRQELFFSDVTGALIESGFHADKAEDLLWVWIREEYFPEQVGMLATREAADQKHTVNLIRDALNATGCFRNIMPDALAE